jgi:hypothetical protein
MTSPGDDVLGERPHPDQVLKGKKVCLSSLTGSATSAFCIADRYSQAVVYWACTPLSRTATY